jgi:hypothetical protein
MNIRLPINRSILTVPAWAIILALLWPVVFFSFMVHSFADGGDAFNGKIENGHYFLRQNSHTDVTPYLEVSLGRYQANYIHAVATMVLFIPAAIGICRIVLPVLKQAQHTSAAP